MFRLASAKSNIAQPSAISIRRCACIVEPVYCLREPVYCLREPVYCLREPVYCLREPVYCLREPVYCLREPSCLRMSRSKFLQLFTNKPHRKTCYMKCKDQKAVPTTLQVHSSAEVHQLHARWPWTSTVLSLPKPTRGRNFIRWQQYIR